MRNMDGDYFSDKSSKMSIPCYSSSKKYKGFQNEDNNSCTEYYTSYALIDLNC